MGKNTSPRERMKRWRVSLPKISRKVSPSVVESFVGIETFKVESRISEKSVSGAKISGEGISKDTTSAKNFGPGETLAQPSKITNLEGGGEKLARSTYLAFSNPNFSTRGRRPRDRMTKNLKDAVARKNLGETFENSFSSGVTR